MAEPAELYLAIDQGGHASRALVFDARGAVVARGLQEVHVSHPQPDRVEQDPEELIASIRAAIDVAVGALGMRARAIAAAGLATQRSSIVCWDRTTGTALSPVISWQDRRAHAWLGQFSARAGDIHQRTGLMLSAHYGASKLRWCLDHLPSVKQAQAEGRLAMGPLASFLLFRLLEERPLWVDPANAGRTLLWNLDTRNWDPELLNLFGIPADVLPRCVPTRHAFGTLRAGAQTLPLTVTNGDQSAALFAYGAPQADTAYINLGTGAFVQRTLGHHPGHSPRLLTGIVLDDGSELTYVIEGTVNGAGAALDWIGAELGITDLEAQLPAWLGQEPEPPLFLNGVSGLGAPFWIPDFVSRFVGGGEDWQKAVAVAESIVFLLQVNLEEMQPLAPPIARLCVTGGLSWYDGLCQRLADLSGLSVYRPAEYEATARGTAYLLAGCSADWPEPEPGTWFRPQSNPDLRARYERWRAAMPRIQN
jgi:glycerol kinase